MYPTGLSKPRGDQVPTLAATHTPFVLSLSTAAMSAASKAAAPLKRGSPLLITAAVMKEFSPQDGTHSTETPLQIGAV